MSMCTHREKECIKDSSQSPQAGCAVEPPLAKWMFSLDPESLGKIFKVSWPIKSRSSNNHGTENAGLQDSVSSYRIFVCVCLCVGGKERSKALEKR